jgi:hypothetical protein
MMIDRVVSDRGGMRAALARLERDAAFHATAVTQAFGRLEQLDHAWCEVDPSDPIREAALRFLRVHPLPAADVLQLAADFMPRNSDHRHSRWSRSMIGWAAAARKGTSS